MTIKDGRIVSYMTVKPELLKYISVVLMLNGINMKSISAIIVLFIFTTEVVPQACCSAGVPILGSLETSTARQNTLQLSLSYDYNNLQTVLEGSQKIDDDTRQRLTNSLLLESTYGIFDRFSVTGLITYINQQRIITSTLGEENSLSTSGFGDALLLFKYEVISQTIVNQMQLAFGAGPKIPTGASDVTQNGILLPADMQQGSGSWDFVLWGYFSDGYMPQVPLNIFAVVSYKINTSNVRFNNSEAGYKFGNEFVSSIGAGFRTDSIFDYSLAFRLRTTSVDQFDDQDVPNTGGVWFYAVPGLNVKIGDYLTTRISGQIPIYRFLEGTQLTTTHSIMASIFYNYSFL